MQTFRFPPNSTSVSKKGKIKIEKNEEKYELEKINEYKSVIKNLILHKLTHLCTYFVLVFNTITPEMEMY